MASLGKILNIGQEGDMKYSLDCYIKTDNDGIRNAVQQLIPSIDDNRVWSGEYTCVDAVDEIDGIKTFLCRVGFNLESDRAGIVTSIKGLTGIINNCEVGSYVREHKCFNDETPLKPCEVETILRKD
jgi:hypothetical protein